MRWMFAGQGTVGQDELLLLTDGNGVRRHDLPRRGSYNPAGQIFESCIKNCHMAMDLVIALRLKFNPLTM